MKGAYLRYMIILFLIFTAFTFQIFAGNVPEEGNSKELSLVAYYSFNGDANDYSGYENHGTNYGALPVKDRFYSENCAYEFTGDYVLAGVDPGAMGIASISLWFNNRGGDGSAYQMDTIFGRSRSGSTQDIMVGINSSNQVGVYLSEVGGSDFYSPDTYLNGWHHLAFLYYSENWVELYIDGVLQTHKTITSSWYSGYLPIGDALYNYDEYFNGCIDEVRIYDYLLTGEEISDLSSHFRNGLCAYYPFDGNVNDFSGFNNHAENFGAVAADNRYSEPNSAFEFNDSTGYVTAGVDPGAMDSSSISLWFCNKGGDGSGYDIDTIFGRSRSSTSQDMMVGINDSNQVYIYMTEVGGTDYNTSASYLNDWHYLTFLYVQKEWVELYIDGVFQTHSTITDTWFTDGLPIGDALYGSTVRFNGTIDEVRIYDYLLSQNEINDLYGSTLPPGIPGNISIEESGTDIIITWEPVAGTVSYRVFASDDPYGSFSDITEEGVMDGESWTYPFDGVKRFFYVTAVDGTKTGRLRK